MRNDSIHYTVTSKKYCKPNHFRGYYISRLDLTIPFQGDLISKFLYLLDVL